MAEIQPQPRQSAGLVDLLRKYEQQRIQTARPVRRYAEGGAVNAAQYDPADIARRAASLMEEIDAA